MDKETGWGIVRRYWWVVVLFAVLGGLVGAIPSPQKAQDATLSFQATHTLLLSSTNGNLFSDPVALNQIQLFATTGEVPKRAAAALGISPADISISPSLDQTTGALSLTATEPTAARAVAMADAVATALTKYIVERQDDQRNDRLAASLDRQKTLEKKITDLEKKVAASPNDQIISAQLEAVRSQYVVVLQSYDALNSDDAGFLQMNTLQTAEAHQIVNNGLRAPRSRSTRGALAGFIGVFVGGAVAFVLSRLDRRIRTRVQAESVVGLRAQGTIPTAEAGALKGLAVTGDRHDSLSDAYRSLRSVIEFAEAGHAKADGRAPVIVVVSPTMGDGKTSVSANLAAAFVEAGKNTIAVNADFRRPALAARILGDDPPPLEFTLDELASISGASLLSASSTPGLAVVDLASVKGSPGDLARLTAKAVRELTELSDAIIVDTSPMTVTAEVLELIPLADVVVVVTRLDQTPITAATRTMDTLRALDPPHLLLVVVGEAAERSSYYYRYSADPEKSRWWKRG